MCQWRHVFLMLVAAGVSGAGLSAADASAADRARAAAVEAQMPARATGTFVQKKTLADVEVTITSTGTFVFEKGKSFTWNTLKPLPSSFIATPTNYTLTVNGKKTTRRLKTDVDQIAKIFEIKEVKDFVKDVTSRPAQGFPDEVTVSFKNGDVLQIELKRDDD